jgi:hypothetical protein
MVVSVKPFVYIQHHTKLVGNKCKLVLEPPYYTRRYHLPCMHRQLSIVRH